MSRFFDLVSKPARDMGSHLPGLPPKHPADGTAAKLIRLDSNENPLGPSPAAIMAMQSVLAASNSYPDDDCTELRRRLASHHEVATEQVLVTVGSTAMQSLLCQTMLGPGLNAVTSERSFIVYGMAVHATGAQFLETPMRDDGFDLPAILGAINEHTRIVFLANPNNPTGTLLDPVSVDEFIARTPEHVVVVLDEAYYDFAAHFASLRRVEYSRSLSYVKRGANVVVLRTFSKAHGLAGLRVGYGLGPAELLAYCARMRDTFSVSSIAQAAAMAALDDQNHIQRVVGSNAEQALVLTEGLSQLGYKVVPTWANFVYCDVGEDAAALAGRLREEGVSIRPLNAWGAPTCIRVSVGTAEQNEFFLAALRRVGKASQPT
jgi:histidinol-phosphate aminotransferase